MEAIKGRMTLLERVSQTITVWAGTSVAFAVAAAVVAVWLALGPVFKFSDTWQLTMNTGAAVTTFLMVFLIQRTQNKDAQAVHLKLNEVVAALEGASNRLVDVEKLSEQDLTVLRQYYAQLSELAKRDESLTKSHSVEEAAKVEAQRAEEMRRQGRQGTGGAAA